MKQIAKEQRDQSIYFSLQVLSHNRHLKINKEACPVNQIDTKN
jgi:hypothetical protein